MFAAGRQGDGCRILDVQGIASEFAKPKGGDILVDRMIGQIFHEDVILMSPGMMILVGDDVGVESCSKSSDKVIRWLVW